MDWEKRQFNKWLGGQIQDLELLLKLLRAARAGVDPHIRWKVDGVVSCFMGAHHATDEAMTVAHAAEEIHYLDVIKTTADELLASGYEDPPFAALTFINDARRDPALIRQIVALAKFMGCLPAPPAAKKLIDGRVAPEELERPKKRD